MLLVAVVLGSLYFLKNSDGKNIVEQKRDFVNEAKVTLLQTRIVRLREALNAYFTDHGEYPELMDLLVPDYLQNQQELQDPWGMPMRLERDESLNTIVLSAGPDGAWDTDDDISRSF